LPDAFDCTLLDEDKPIMPPNVLFVCAVWALATVAPFEFTDAADWLFVLVFDMPPLVTFANVPPMESASAHTHICVHTPTDTAIVRVRGRLRR
jgi:hypothetical protein